MPRIEKVPNPEAKDSVLWQGHRPRMASAALALSQAVYQETTLSFREAEAGRMRVTHYSGCMICRNFRVADGLEALLQKLNSGEQANVAGARGPKPTEAFYEAIAHWRTSDQFSERERLIIEYAERLTELPRELPHDDAFWERMHAHFDDGEIVDATYSLTTWIAAGRFVHALGLDDVCALAPPLEAVA